MSFYLAVFNDSMLQKLTKKFFNPKKQMGVQGIAFGIVDGVIAMLGTTLAISVLSNNTLLILVTGLAVGISNGLANAAGFYISEEVEVEHGLSDHTKKDILKIAFFCFLASVLAVLIPLSSYLYLSFNWARLTSVAVGLLILFALGVYHAVISREGRIREGIKFLLIGLAATLLSYCVGVAINYWAV